MSLKLDERYSLTKKAAAGVVVFILFVAFAMFIAGFSVGGSGITTTTVGVKTDLITTTLYNQSVIFSTVTTVQEVTTTQLSLVTWLGPDTIKITGTASVHGATEGGATQIEFLPVSGAAAITAPIVGGSYSATLDNHKDYTVKIDYSGTVGGLGSGSCIGGGLVLYAQGDAITADWSCS